MTDTFAVPEGHPSPRWVRPRRLSEISPTWWDVVLNGHIWAVNLDEDPLLKWAGLYSFKGAVYRQVDKRQLNVSIRTAKETGNLVYIQAFPKGTSALEARQPVSEAVNAPPIPSFAQLAKMPPPPPKPPVFDYSEIQEALLLRQQELGLPSYPPVALRRHNVLGWVAQDCTCGTVNLRAHQAGCKVAEGMLILEAQIKFCKQEPEEWCQIQERWGPLYESTRQAARAAVDDARDQVL